MPDLKSIAFNLDEEINSIGISLDKLVDAEILLGQLVEDMYQAVHQGQEKAYYQVHFRMVRIISYLYRHSVDELSKKLEKAEKTRNQLFEFKEQTDLNGVNETPPGKAGVLSE